eukprot:6175387-Pleurochrysis_carterae.AAC.5
MLKSWARRILGAVQIVAGKPLPVQWLGRVARSIQKHRGRALGSGSHEARTRGRALRGAAARERVVFGRAGCTHSRPDAGSTAALQPAGSAGAGPLAPVRLRAYGGHNAESGRR